MKGDIYRGRVTAVDGRYATVALVDAPKCEGCAISSACGSRPSERTVKAVAVAGVHPGDAVEVSCPPSAQTHSLLIGIVVPCIIIIGVTLIAELSGLSSRNSAACGLASIVLYYILAFALRRRFSSRLDWRIVQKKDD